MNYRGRISVAAGYTTFGERQYPLPRTKRKTAAAAVLLAAGWMMMIRVARRWNGKIILRCTGCPVSPKTLQIKS
jgi:hypothetical protein